MISHAKAKFLRISPVKMRQVIDLIRGKEVNSSLAILMQVNKGSKEKVLKVLNSAIANAKQKGLSEDQLYISKITADHGPAWKRYRAAAFGRANPILKRTTHLIVELDLITK
jgi:large subunit ribosomal protein L22